MGRYVRTPQGGFIAWPRPFPHKIFPRWTGTANYKGNLYPIPDLAANDGSYWLIDPSAGSIRRFNGSGTLVWTIAAAADVNANAAGIACYLIDYTDARIYALFGNSVGGGNSPFWVSNPLATKSVTVANPTATWTNAAASPYFLDRPGGQGTGNLRVYQLGNTTPEFRDISTAGVFQGTTQPFQIGAVNPLFDNNGAPSRPYITQNGLALLNFDNGTPMVFNVQRGGGYGAVSTAATNRPIVQGTTNVRPTLIINGTTVCVHTSEEGTQTGVTSVAKSFDRAAFDAFINTLADAAGCP